MTQAKDLPRLARTAPAPKRGIVHFGPGAFFRAFVARYTADAIAADSGGDSRNWGITAVSLKSTGARAALAPQGGAYTAVTLAPGGRQADCVEIIGEVIVAPEDPAAVLRALTDPGVHIVTLTLTEKGYCRDPGTGGLALDHPDVAHDLAAPNAPRSAIGFLTTALAQRRAAGLPPFTVVSCDNLPQNGAVTQRLVREMALLRAPELADWISERGAFPSTMVDRITPATTEADIEALSKDRGRFDPAMVVHEPFRQWVIEDHFAGPRPAWHLAGAQLVPDVAAFEHMKLRCLNGAHSCLAYLGYLAGHRTVSSVSCDPAFARYLEGIWRQEICPTVPGPMGIRLDAYCDALLERFQNPAIEHLTWQIAMDGSQKLPQRILETITECYANQRDASGLCLAIAAWMRFVSGTDEAGQRIDVKDPMSNTLSQAWDAGGSPSEKVDNFLKLPGIFPVNLQQSARFRASVLERLEVLLDQGTQAALAHFERAD